MAAARPVTAREVQRVRELHGAGESLGAIARALGRSRSTVHRIAREEALSFAREQTAAAAAAVVVDARALRAEQALGLIDDARRLRARLFAPYTLHSFGGAEHTHREVEIPEPPPGDQRALMSAASTALVTSMRLDDHDNDNGASAAVSMLGNLMGQLQDVAGPYVDPHAHEPEQGA